MYSGRWMIEYVDGDADYVEAEDFLDFVLDHLEVQDPELTRLDYVDLAQRLVEDSPRGVYEVRYDDETIAALWVTYSEGDIF